MTLQSIKVFWGKFGTAFFMGLSIYRIWSKIYQFVWQRKNVLPLKRFKNMNELVTYVSDLKWRADSWFELGDAISSPYAVQWLAENEPKKFIGDCDEFGVYQAAVINNELDLESVGSDFFATQGILEAYVCSVTWYKYGGETWTSNELGYGGHNVCLMKHLDGKWSYMDYSYPSQKFDTIAEVAELVRQRYAQVYEPISWTASDPVTLKKIAMEVHW